MLPDHEWLHVAKRLAVGMKTRVRHRQENRLNLVIGNDPEKYWAYCQRCHEGAVLAKEHVMLTNEPTVATEALELPDDLTIVKGSTYEVEVARFLCTKGMALTYLPFNLQVSFKARRLFIVGIDDSWENTSHHGRDLTGKSKTKWMNYTGEHIHVLPHYGRANVAVVTEDLFSAYKVQWACRNSGIDVSVICALGTDTKDALVMELCHYTKIVWFFDNDPAGQTGALAGHRRMKVFNTRQAVIFPPIGCDPKDMPCEDIVQQLKEVL